MFNITTSRHFDFYWIDYSISEGRYRLVPEECYQSLEVDVDQPFASWGDIRTTIEDMCEEGFDRPVKHVVVDDRTCVFLQSEKGWTRTDYEEWIAEGKNVFDSSDIRDIVSLPDNIHSFDQVIFVMFYEEDDEEDSTLQWATFVPTE